MSGNTRSWYRVFVGYRLRTNLGLAYTFKHTAATVFVQHDPNSPKFVQAVWEALPHMVRWTDDLTIYTVEGPYSTKESATNSDSSDPALMADAARREREASERVQRAAEADRERWKRADEELAAARLDGSAYVLSWTHGGVSETATFIEKDEATRRAYDLVSQADTATVSIVGPGFTWEETPNGRLRAQIATAPESRGICDFLFFQHGVQKAVGALNQFLADVGVQVSSSNLEGLPEVLNHLPATMRDDADVLKHFRALQMFVPTMLRAREDAAVHATDEGFVRACWRYFAGRGSLAELESPELLELVLGADLVLEASPHDAPIATLVHNLDGLSADEQESLNRRLFAENPFVEHDAAGTGEESLNQPLR
jgi:hypothetical protein